jgi:replicative superfamily II helicase
LVNMWNIFMQIKNVKNEAENLKTVLLNIINNNEISNMYKYKNMLTNTYYNCNIITYYKRNTRSN